MAKSKNMSFLPEDYLDRRTARRTNVICITLFVIVVGGLVGAYWFRYRTADAVRHRHQQINAQFKEAADRLAQLEQLQARKQKMIHKAEVTSALVERVPRTTLLAELINHMPTQLSLLEFDLETEVVRNQSHPRTSLQRRRQQMKQNQQNDAEVELPETEMNIHLVGVAPTDVEVAQFMTALSQHELFTDLNLQYSEETTIEKQKMREFRIDMKVNQDINVKQMEPTRVKRELKQDPMADTVDISPTSQFDAPSSDTQTQE